MTTLFDEKDFTMTPEQLAFSEGCFKGLPRPNGSHDSVKRLVADELMPQILDWLQGQEDDEDEVREQLIDVLEDHRDGYEMAKRLEDDYDWDCDSELVDILDGSNFYEHRKAAVMAWIRDNGIMPRFAMGQEVKVKQSRYDKTIHDGEIRAVNVDGTYTVMIPALGHVREGIGTHGSVLPWEDVEDLNPAA